MSPVLATVAFLLAAALIAVRPFGLDEGLAACSLALLDVAMGVLPPVAAVLAFVDAIPVLVFFAILLTLVGAFVQSSHFDRLSGAIAASGRRGPIWLLATVLGLAVVLTVVGTNDATALVVPVTIAPLVLAHRLPPTPFVLGTAFVANSASLVLPTSNPATLLALSHLHLPVVATVLPLLAAGSAATLVTLVLVLAGARRSLPSTLRAGLDSAPTAGPKRMAPWSLLALVAGFSLLVAGLEQTGVTGATASLIKGVSPLMAGTAAALAANLLNNLPTAIAIGAVVPHGPAHILAVIAGADVGPNLTPLGSLSNLLILSAARRQGIAISWPRFVLWGVVIAPASVGAALLALRLTV